MVTVLLQLKSMQMRPTSSNPLNEPTQKRPDAQDAPSPGLSGVPSAGGKVARRFESAGKRWAGGERVNPDNHREQARSRRGCGSEAIH